MDFPQDVIDRFWSKVDRKGVEECWPWLGTRSPKGYGNFYSGGKRHRASRVALSLTVGCGAAADFALHSCDNPPCCNPLHLSWGSNEENMRQALERGRITTQNAAYKLMPSQLDYIAKLVRAGYGNRKIATWYGISTTRARKIIRKMKALS